MEKSLLNSVQINDFHSLPTCAVAGELFFKHFANWTRFAKNTKQKIKVVISYDPETGRLDFSFSEIEETFKENQKKVVGIDSLNEHLAEGWTLKEVIKPRTSPTTFLIEKN